MVVELPPTIVGSLPSQPLAIKNSINSGVIELATSELYCDSASPLIFRASASALALIRAACASASALALASASALALASASALACSSAAFTAASYSALWSCLRASPASVNPRYSCKFPTLSAHAARCFTYRARNRTVSSSYVPSALGCRARIFPSLPKPILSIF